jgi:hypothetical protein
MKVSKDLEQKLGFNIKTYDTKTAVEKYNERIKGTERIAGAFHITC